MTTERPQAVWLDSTQVRMLHAASIELFGGAPGLRDPGLLESALARPVNRWHYDRGQSLSELAASYAFGIARNHPFVDGNKRAALLAIRAFLFRNGVQFAPDQIETVSMIEGLSAGRIDEKVLSVWIEACCRS